MTHAEKRLRNAEIARRAMAGDSYKEIARFYDLHANTIYLIARPALIAAGISRKQKKSVRNLQIVRMACEGKSYKRIANILCVPIDTVRHVARPALRELGIAQKPRERWHVA
jgi:DNA-binding CsgD family transcriptional regulator